MTKQYKIDIDFDAINKKDGNPTLQEIIQSKNQIKLIKDFITKTKDYHHLVFKTKRLTPYIQVIIKRNYQSDYKGYYLLHFTQKEDLENQQNTDCDNENDMNVYLSKMKKKIATK